MDKNELRSLLQISITAAIEAGREILKVYNSDNFEIELKSDNTPLTKADKISHQIITERLAETEIFGTKIPVLSEEGKNIPYEERKNWQLFWIVDPLDGTKEFIKRNGEFTVNIALLEKNEPVLGVIYAPADNRENTNLVENFSFGGLMTENNSNIWLYNFLNGIENFPGAIYFAADCEGVYKVKDKKVYKLDNNQNLINPDKLTAVSSRSHSSDEEKKKLEEFGVQNFVSVGSSLKFCLVAEGEAVGKGMAVVDLDFP